MPRPGRCGTAGASTTPTRAFRTPPPPGFAAADVGRLKVKWAFGFPGDQSAYAQPAVVGGRVFVGSPGGVVYALSAATGCVHWFFDAERPVRTAVMISRVRTTGGQRDAAFFGDQGGTAYALDAATGALLWKTKVEDFPGSRVTGSPVFHNGRLYVPVASGEETAGAAPDYQCCRSRGSLVALDAATGKQVWKTYMIPEEPIPTKKSTRRDAAVGAVGCVDLEQSHHRRQAQHRCMSAPATTSATRRPARATRSWRWISRRERSAGPAR